MPLLQCCQAGIWLKGYWIELNYTAEIAVTTGQFFLGWNDIHSLCCTAKVQI